MELKQVIESCGFRISDGCEYQWQCYGDNARYMDFADKDGKEYASVIFDTKDQTVYEFHLNVPGYDQAFGWWNPDFEKKYLKEAKKRDVTPYQAWDEVMYEKTDEATMLQYAKDIGETYYDDLPIPEEMQ